MTIVKRTVSLFAVVLIAFFLVTPASAASAANYKFNMSYIYFGNSSKYTALVNATQDSMNEVAPNYFSLDENGTLVITSAAKTSFVTDMHATGIQVVPYLTNDWDQDAGIKALENKEALAASLASAVAAYELDGINIDLENLTVNERTDYVDLVRLLRELLPADKKIVVAVAVKPGGTETSWSASYDYAGLAKYCNYLMLMAYDESYYGSKSKPVASYAFVENSVKYAVSQVPKEKIVLGLPFYGRIWSDSGDYPQGYGISNTTVDQLVAQYDCTGTYDTPSRSARAQITIEPADDKPVVGGHELAAGTYTIWYENEQSLKAKLSLIEKYDLKGAGSWSLGQETAGTWDYYKLWLNGCTFGDVQDNWSKEYVLTAYKNGWVNGTSDTNFEPDTNLTRAQAATMLVRRLGLPVESNRSYGFGDTSGSWASDYINTARKYQIVNGVGGNEFAPDRPVTREETAVMLNNILHFSCSTSADGFKDVSAGSNPWSYDAIYALCDNNVVTGYPDGSFRPGTYVSRAEMTALMCRIDPV